MSGRGGRRRRPVPAPQMSADELNTWFYQGFDPGFLYHKVQAIRFVLDNLGPYDLWQKQDSPPENPFPWNPDYRFVPALHAELYFTTIHQVEGFLALLLATFQPQPHWEYLTTYSTRDMSDAAQKVIDGKIAELTDSRFTEKRPFIAAAVYSDTISDEEPARSRWDENLDNAYELVEWMARYYLDGRDAYNSYKHGIRVVSGTVDQWTEHGLQRLADNGLAYLTVDGDQVCEVTREFAPEQSLYFMSTMHRMQETIRGTRLKGLRGEAEGKPRINTFLDIPHEQLREWSQTLESSQPR